MNKIPHLKIKLIATVIFAAYLAAGWFTVGIKCFFSLIFAIPCPFCGMTRAFVSAVKLDFASAFEYHSMFWSLPIIYLLFLYEGKIFKNKHINVAIWVLMCLGFSANWISHIA